jgi:hypothetical protein
MLRTLFAAMILTLSLVTAVMAAQTKVFVADVTIAGAQNGDQLKAAMPGLLSSRLAAQNLTAVNDRKDADVEISGMFTQFGGVFSIDLIAKDATGKVVARAFEQGEGDKQVIPALGTVAQKLSDALHKVNVSTAQPGAVVAASAVAAAPAPIAAAASVPAQQPAVATDIVRTANIIAGSPVGRSIERIQGAMQAMAPGKKLANGDQEIFTASKQSFGVYLFGENGTRKLASESFPVDRHVITIDSADLDNDGTPEAYLTIVAGERVASQVWEFRDGKLRKIADLPYYFRSIRLAGGVDKVYVQEDSIDTEFYGDVMELVKKGSVFSTQNPVKLPKKANLFTFNQFKDRTGKLMFVLFHPDGYLTVNDTSGEEIWRSADSFGGSESYFKRYNAEALRSGPTPYRTTFLQQRILVQDDGSIIVPRNFGGWQIGNTRSYTKNAVYCFGWNGSALVDMWHTKESQNYLADFFYDAAKRELVLLEVVKKESPIDKGASAILTKKID